MDAAAMQEDSELTDDILLPDMIAERNTSSSPITRLDSCSKASLYGNHGFAMPVFEWTIGLETQFAAGNNVLLRWLGVKGRDKFRVYRNETVESGCVLVFAN